MADLSPPPPNADDYCRMGLALCLDGNINAAIIKWKEALRFDATHADSLYNLAVAYNDTGDETKAFMTFSRLLDFHPEHEKGRFNLGNLLFRMGRTDDAISTYAPLLNTPHPSRDALINLGRSLRRTGRLEEADACYRRALHDAPDDPFIHWNRAHTLCLMGQWEAGFTAWEHRLAAGIQPPVMPDAPEWHGIQTGPIPPSLLLIGEQGHGDTIQCLRYLPILLAADCKLTLAVHTALIPFLKTLLPQVSIIEFSKVSTLRDHAWAPLFSLPHRLKRPAPTQTLAPHQDTYFRDIIQNVYPRPSLPLAPHAAKEPYRIGLTWAGNPRHENDHLRSMPGQLLRQLVQEFPQFQWHSLQMDSATEELEDLIGNGNLVAPPPVQSFADTAQAACKVDLIICVDTAIAHIAGTLGIPCWMMLAAEPDWRWGQTGSATPWYPTTRLFRQTILGDWSPVISEISMALSRVASESGNEI